MQRVSRAAVRVDGAVTGEIGRGLVVLLAVERDATGLGVAEGVFRAMMQVELVNDGPVTLLLDSKGEF